MNNRCLISMISAFMMFCATSLYSQFPSDLLPLNRQELGDSMTAAKAKITTEQERITSDSLRLDSLREVLGDSIQAVQAEMHDSLWARVDSAFKTEMYDSLANKEPLGGGGGGSGLDSVLVQGWISDSSNVIRGEAALHDGTWRLDGALGSDSTWSGITASMTVDANTYGLGNALHMDTDGNWIDADADAEATMPCMALGLQSGTGTKLVFLQGFVREDDWAWTVGGLIYVSCTAGALTQTAPVGVGDQIQPVGFATSADCMFFNPAAYLVEHK